MGNVLTGAVLNPTVVRGKSAYEIAKDEGFPGDEAAWLASLKADALPDIERLTHETIPVLVLNGAEAPDFSKLELYFIVRVYRESGARYSGHQRLDVDPLQVTGETKAVFNTVNFFRDGTNRIDREQLRVCNKMSDYSIRVFFQYFNGDTGVEMVSPGVNKNFYLTKDMDYVVVESY